MVDASAIVGSVMSRLSNQNRMKRLTPRDTKHVTHLDAALQLLSGVYDSRDRLHKLMPVSGAPSRGLWSAPSKGLYTLWYPGPERLATGLYHVRFGSNSYCSCARWPPPLDATNVCFRFLQPISAIGINIFGAIGLKAAFVVLSEGKLLSSAGKRGLRKPPTRSKVGTSLEGVGRSPSC